MAQRVVVSTGTDHDLTAYLRYGSMTVKLNTCDFTLVDSPLLVSLGNLVTVKDPGWTGTVVQVILADLVDLPTGHRLTVVTATNANPIVARPAPFVLSDAPSAAAVSHFLLEDGSGALVLEDGSAFAPGDYALESPTDSYGYRGLSLLTQTNIADQSTTTKLTATIFQPGLWPGMTVKVSSANLALSSAPYVVSQVTTTGLPDLPTFEVEMTASLTDTLPTLSKWRLTG